MDDSEAVIQEENAATLVAAAPPIASATKVADTTGVKDQKTARQSLPARLLDAFRSSRREAFYNRVNDMRERKRAILAAFEKLACLNPAERVLILQPIRQAANIEVIYLKRKANTYTPLVLVNILMIICMFGSPAITNHWLQQGGSFGRWLGVYALYFIGFYLLFGLAYFPWLAMEKQPVRRSGSPGIALAWLVLVLIGLVVTTWIFSPRLGWIIRQPDLLALVSQVLLSIMFTYILLGIMVLIYSGYSLLAPSFLQSFEKRHVDAKIIIELMKLISLIEDAPGRWNELAYKRSINQQIERVALRIERDLPGQLVSGDLATDAWYRRMIMQIAASLREKKKWVLTPRVDSRNFLLEQLKNDLICAACGSWDGVSRKNPEVVTARSLLRSTWHFLAALVRGLLPLTALLVIQSYFWTPSEQLSSTLLIISLIWLVLSILMELDPRFKEKLDNLKAVKDLLPK